jgi:tetratricopeptide (TPR) repeat protein
MSAALNDRWGVPVQGATPDGIAALDDAIECLLSLAGDPIGQAEAAVSAAPGMVFGQIYRAYLSLYGQTAAGVAEAGKLLSGLDPSGAPAPGSTTSNSGPISHTGPITHTGPIGPPGLARREMLHLRAARAWTAGDLQTATRALERALVLNPRDVLALKVAQDLYFFTGSRLDLRDVAARVLRSWPEGQPGWGYVQGIYAFGLEENADYRQAENRATAALADNPRDVWSVHALAHVYEMEGRQREGSAFLSATLPDWQRSYFAVHNWWHRALYHLELGDVKEALALYDRSIRASRSTEWLDIIDAAALLWRLALFGADVSSRATELATDVEPLMDTAPVYIFNDWHAVMAFGLAGWQQQADRVLTNNTKLTAPTNRSAAAQAGLALLGGFRAYAAGHPEQALNRMIDIRQTANVVGGSHAQRDVIDLTLIAAAARVGDEGLARALADERTARKPTSSNATQALIAANTITPAA